MSWSNRDFSFARYCLDKDNILKNLIERFNDDTMYFKLTEGEAK